MINILKQLITFNKNEKEIFREEKEFFFSDLYSLLEQAELRALDRLVLNLFFFTHFLLTVASIKLFCVFFRCLKIFAAHT